MHMHMVELVIQGIELITTPHLELQIRERSEGVELHAVMCKRGNASCNLKLSFPRRAVMCIFICAWTHLEKLQACMTPNPAFHGHCVFRLDVITSLLMT